MALNSVRAFRLALIPTLTFATALTVHAGVGSTLRPLPGHRSPARTSQAPATQSPGDARRAKRAADIQRWIQQLGDDDYKVRKRAEEFLAQAGEASVEALEGAKDSKDPEIRWRARRILRALQSPAGGGLKPRAKSGTEPGSGAGGQQGEQAPQGSGEANTTPETRRTVDDVFDRMFQELERRGLDVQRGRFFRQDFFKDLDSQLQDRERLVDRLQGAEQRLKDLDPGRLELRWVRPERRFFGLDGQPGATKHFRFDGNGSSSQITIQEGPDGVRVEVTETDADGKETTKTFEGESMEALLKQHPELEGKVGGFGLPKIDQSWPGLRFREGGMFGQNGFTERDGPAFGWRFDPMTGEPLQRFQVPTPFVQREGLFPRGGRIRGWDPDGPQPAEAPPVGARLGVTVQAPAPAVAEFLGFEPGAGLQVGEVGEGSLAEALGLRPGDILLTLGKQPIRSVADVQRVLQAIPKGETVRVEVSRRGRTITGSSAKRHDAEEAGASPQQQAQQPKIEQPGQGGLRRRR